MVSTSCSSVSHDAARVNDQTLSNADFDNLVEGFTAAVPTALRSTGSVDGDTARSLLTDWITTVAIETALGKEGITVTSDDDAKAMADLMGQSSFAAASPEVRDFYAHATAVRDVLASQTAPSDDELEALYNEGVESSGVVCARAILVATADDMTAVQARLDKGDDFATVASDLSTDTTGEGGGVLSNPKDGTACTGWADLSSSITPEFADALVAAEVNVPSDPFEIAGAGWVILLLRPFSEVADDARPLMSSGSSLEYVKSAIDASTVWVSPEYGVFDPTTPSVVAIG